MPAGSPGVGFVGGGLGFGLGRVRGGDIVEAGEAVGDGLSCGAGGGFFFVCGGFGGCGLFGCGASGGRGGGASAKGLESVGWKRGLHAGDDEDLFQLEEVGGGFDADGGVGLVLGIRCDGLNCADGEAAGEDLVTAGGEDCFAGLDAIVGGEIADLHATAGGAADDGADAGAGQDDAGTGGLVVYEEHLRGVRSGLREDVSDLADDTVGGDHGHVGLETVGGAFIDVEDAGELGSAGSDDLCRDGGGDVVLLKGEEGLEAVALDGVLGDGGLLEAKLIDLDLEVTVVLADVAEVDVVGPDGAETVAGVEEEALDGGDDGDDQGAGERHTGAVGGAGFDGAPHLDGKGDDLREQKREQHQSVLEAGEEGIHTTLALIIPRDDRPNGYAPGFAVYLMRMGRAGRGGGGVGERPRRARFGVRDWLIAFMLLLATIQCVRADFLVNETFLDWHGYAHGQIANPYQSRAGLAPLLRWAGDSARMRHYAERYAITVTIGTRHIEPITVEKFTSMLIGLVSLMAMMLTVFWWSRRRGLEPWWIANVLVLVMATAMMVMRATTNYWYAYDLPHAAMFGMAAVFALEGLWGPMLLCFALDVPTRETSLFLVIVVGAVMWVRQRASVGRVWKTIAMMGGMGLYWLAVRWAIGRHFAGNPNETYPRMGQNLHEILFPHHWPQLFTAGGYLLIFIWLERRRLGLEQRALLYGCLACFPITLWFGVWTESRVWLEWTLPMAALATVEAVDWMRSYRVKGMA